MLFFGSQVIAVILAVFVHRANGRTFTSTRGEAYENLTEREKNSADVLRLTEPDSSSHEVVQFQFSDDVSSESVSKGSDNAILPMEANPVWRHKKSLPDEPECRTGVYKTIRVKHTALTKILVYPECRPTAQFTACSSSMENNDNKRKCVPSNYKYCPKYNVTIPTKCAP